MTLGPTHESDDITAWATRIERLIREDGIGLVNRVMVLAETASTQDAARRLSDGRPGLLVLAGRQTSGRGRLGRAWADTAGLGVAATFVLPGDSMDDARLSLWAGIATAGACDHGLLHSGLRWPNDVVESTHPHRKLAGVLIERERGLAYLGIGVNVLQRDMDWPQDLKTRAVSLRQLGVDLTRLDLACNLVTSLELLRAVGVDDLAAHWRERDTLLGTQRTFIHDNHRFDGTVLRIDPTSAVHLRLNDGREVSLPARTTSLVHE